MGKTNNSAIAIIGMGCLFPKSNDIQEFWNLISHGIDGITDVPESHWKKSDYLDLDPKKVDRLYTTRGGYLPTTQFDPTEFGIPPNILEATDTSQLLSLVVAKMALEDSGYGENGKKYDNEKVSVILGVTGTQELVISLGARLGFPKWKRALLDSGLSEEKVDEIVSRIGDEYVSWQENSFPGLLGNVVAGRIANRFDFGGTNLVIDAACASSLGALELSCLELNSGKVDMVMSGGVDTLNDIFMHMCFTKTPALSPSGEISPFSDKADGTLLGEGIGLYMLKRLADAERDKDRIYAVIKGIGTSSDGRYKSIYAPRAEGQMKALRRAYQNAEVDPTSIELIEAHATGTKVGDITEYEALRKVYGDVKRLDSQWCGIGTIKSQIGHTKASAGAAGLIKASLSLYHKVLPPTLKVNQPNPKMDIENSPFYISTDTRPWLKKSDHPRRVGVSSFGFGGSNFHTILEEYRDEKNETVWETDQELIVYSSLSKNNVIQFLEEWKIILSNKNHDKRDIQLKAWECRNQEFSDKSYRIVLHLSLNDNDGLNLIDQVLNQITSPNAPASFNGVNFFYGSPVAELGKIAFLYPGQGSQYVGMGKSLSIVFPEFLESLSLLDKNLSEKIVEKIYPHPVFSKEEKLNQEIELTKTNIAQPAIGVVSVGMDKIIKKFGVNPDVTAGHSYGELVALYSAQKMDEESLYHLSKRRGELMAEVSQKCEESGMMVVIAPLEKIEAVIEKEDLDLVFANRNSHTQGVLSGKLAEIEKAMAVMAKNNIQTKKLHVSAAFHSSIVAPAKEPFRKELEKVSFQKSPIPVYSNMTGIEYPKQQKLMRDLFGNQLVNSVNFVSEIENLYHKEGVRTFIEIGPKSVLTNLTKSILESKNAHIMAMDSSNGKKVGLNDLVKVLGQLFVAGYFVDWKMWGKKPIESKKKKMSIPLVGANYRSPFQRKPATQMEMKDSQLKRQHNATGEHAITLNQDKNRSFKLDKTPVLRQKGKNGSATDSTPNRDVNKVMTREIKENGVGQQVVTTDAFRVIQEGLKSLQSLQIQTAQAHTEFLKGQEQANRTISDLILQSQQVLTNQPIQVGKTLPVVTPAINYNTEPVIPAPIQESKPEASAQIPANVPEEIKVPEHVKFSNEPEVQEEIEPVLQSANATVENSVNLEATILDVVSELTGYPQDMLNLSMDIESDLGIDSIKRVEILSSIEKKIPSLSSITPEVMGKLRTLQEIIDQIKTESSSPSTIQENELVAEERPYSEKKKSEYLEANPS